MTIRGTARFTVKEDDLDAALEAIRAFAAHTATESGTLRYESWRSLDRPTEFLHLMSFADQSAELLTVDNPEDVRTLSNLFAIVPPSEGFRCMCPGDQVIEFTRDDGTVAITLHHGRSIRWDRWNSDAMLADGEALLRWLADKGAPGPLRAWEEDRRRAQEANRAWEAWQRAAPSSIAPFLPELMPGVNPQYPSEQLLAAEEAIRTAHPSEREMILAVLDWFGSGEGPWSGFPSYESVAEALLLRNETEAIVSALGDAQLPPARAEGAARLFASWWFGRLRPREATALPEPLKRRLLEHVRAGGDPDRIARLEHAIGGM